MSDPAKKCSNKGYCPGLSNGECPHTHNKPCSSTNACFNYNCFFIHPVPLCGQFADCTVFECPKRHDKKRTRCCRGKAACPAQDSCPFLHPQHSNSMPNITTTTTTTNSNSSGQGVCRFAPNCKNAKCTFLHPTAATTQTLTAAPASAAPAAATPAITITTDQIIATKPCRSAEKCSNVDCKFSHPLQRPPVCPGGSACVLVTCIRLHPRTPLEVLLSSKAPPSYGNTYKNLSISRNNHKIKMYDAANKSFSAMQAPPNLDDDKKEEKKQIISVLQAQAFEMNQQLKAYDETVTEIISELSNLHAMAATDNDKDVKFKHNNRRYRLNREMYRLKLALPALALRPKIEEAVNQNQFVVIQGATGSGKSTQLPQYISEMLGQGSRVVCTQPRKVSATSLAERVSEEWYFGKTGLIGSDVGYNVGSARKTSERTRIEYVTEGTFLGALLQLFGGARRQQGGQAANKQTEQKDGRQKDPLYGVGAIIIDEAHERSITCDMIMGILHMYAREKWPDLKVLF